MGLGYALTEELPCENGWPVTFKMREIGPLRARDMPDVEVILVEEPEPEALEKPQSEPLSAEDQLQALKKLREQTGF